MCWTELIRRWKMALPLTHSWKIALYRMLYTAPWHWYQLLVRSNNYVHSRWNECRSIPAPSSNFCSSFQQWFRAWGVLLVTAASQCPFKIHTFLLHWNGAELPPTQGLSPRTTSNLRPFAFGMAGCLRNVWCCRSNWLGHKGGNPTYFWVTSSGTVLMHVSEL